MIQYLVSEFFAVKIVDDLKAADIELNKSDLIGSV